MSNIGLIIEERERNIGNFLVGRLLPFRGKRMVGPFIYIDHMGPVRMDDHVNMDIGPHPHIGLSTLTYLFEGAVMHRDSLGTELEIMPGAVNWMTAGNGIVHSERTPERLRAVDKSIHGLQIWVALPKHLEQMDPAFHHVEASALPAWEKDGARFKVIAGEVLGRRSTVPVHSPLYLLEIHANTGCTVRIGNELYGEAGLYILQGEVSDGGEHFGPRQLLVAKDAKLCTFTLAPGTTVYLFGGEPFPEERLIYWNFVATSQALIDEAKERWRRQEFVMPPGEHDPIPLPLETAFKSSR
ncbi:MAG TPA: pirin family protein [Flavobacteriales bacterium]|nr:pirin family protein [Flavobacteriales bacterium]